MAEKSKQHYIPRCYLKAWCDTATPPEQAPYLWIFDKQGKARNKSPENIFHARDMYTIKGINGERDLTIEDGLAGLESQFTSIRNRKLGLKEPLDKREHLLIIYFIAAMYARTQSHIQLMSERWSRPQEIMEDMMQRFDDSTPSEKHYILNRSAAIAAPRSKSLSYEEVKVLAERPVEKMLVPTINTLGRLLSKLDFCVFNTDDKQGFITSDTPCVWHDAEAKNRPFTFQVPALTYETIEITLPISPSQLILLNRQGLNGHYHIRPDDLDAFNRRILLSCQEHFISNMNHIKDTWTLNDL